jgi:hypothetical protein
MNKKSPLHNSGVLRCRDGPCRFVASKPFASGAENGPVDPFPRCQLQQALNAQNTSDIPHAYNVSHVK